MIAAVAMEGLEQDEGAPAVPGALLVEVEDVMEESLPIVDIPDVLAEAPIYSIASPELRQTIESQLEPNPLIFHLYNNFGFHRI